MMRSLVSVVVVVAVAALSHLATGERVKDSVYTEFPPEAIRACFRRLNGTNAIGCTSSLNGNVGVLLYLDAPEDVRLLDVEEFAPYIVLLNPQLFSGNFLEKLKNTDRVVGVILPGVESGRWKDQQPPAQSDDLPCPGQRSSLYRDPKQQCGPSNWNTAGENLLWRDWGFPIFLVKNDTTTEGLYNCYQEYNRVTVNRTEVYWPLCAVELKSLMYGAKDSESCWRRTNLVNTLSPQHYCDPLSDSNIYYYTTQRNRTRQDNSKVVTGEKSVVVVVARMDALNIFDKEEAGFDSPTTGIVTLVSAAKLVAESLRAGSQRGATPYKPGVENILFLLVHGEAFDYIGSSRLVYDMQNNVFPYNLTAVGLDENQQTRLYENGTQQLLRLNNIKIIIELGQLSNRGSSHLYAHTTNQSPVTKQVVDLFNRAGITVKESSAVGFLPPASSQSFLKESGDIPVVMLTNYDTEYSNPYYHSLYDTPANNNFNYTLGTAQGVVRHLASVSRALASTLLSLSTSLTLPQEQTTEGIVNELLNCYTITANCSLYKEASVPGSFPWVAKPLRTLPLPQYVGVHNSYYTYLTKQILQYFTGEVVPDNTSVKESDSSVKDEDSSSEDDEPSIEDKMKSCEERNLNQNVFTYVFLTGEGCYNVTDVHCGKCYKTTVDLTDALSPAFLDSVLPTYDWSSGKYPTWTESIWKSISGRMFLQASPARDHTTLAIGLIVTFFSFLFTLWLEKKSHLIFPPATNPTSLTSDFNPQPVNL